MPTALMSMRIVLIDDNEGIRGLVRGLLDESGCCEVVGEADDGSKAISVVGEYRPDLVVMDWQMPGEDGLIATRRLKSIYPNVEVVALVTMETPELHKKFADAGARALFGKADLARLVDHVVSRAGQGSSEFLPA